MRQFVFAAAAVSILVAGARTTAAGHITYSLQNYAADQAGSTLTGSITTDGNLGTLTAADVIAWTWTVTPPVGASFTQSSGPGISTQVVNLVATDTQLLLPQLQNQISWLFLGPGGDGSGELVYRRERDTSGTVLYALVSANANWLTENPSMGGTDPWVIGVAAAAVPEPSGAVLISMGIAGLLLARRWRR